MTDQLPLPDPPRAPEPLLLGSRSFAPTDLLVMAVINRTPDSFFDGGRTYALDRALEAADAAVNAGADILDVGGVPAGPGAAVDQREEIRRTAGLLGALRARHPQVALSVDTWRAPVARAACAEGVDLINDAWGGWDPALAEVAAEHDAGLVCTHTGGLQPRTVARRPAYDDVVTDVITTVCRLADRAERLGVRRDAILVDPAHDFGKTTAQSLEVTRRLGEVVATGWPVLVAVSRKDFVGETLDLPVKERLEGTLAATAISAWLGARVFRAHDVAATRRVLDLVASVRGTRPPAAPRRSLPTPPAERSGGPDW